MAKSERQIRRDRAKAGKRGIWVEVPDWDGWCAFLEGSRRIHPPLPADPVMRDRKVAEATASWMEATISLYEREKANRVFIQMAKKPDDPTANQTAPTAPIPTFNRDAVRARQKRAAKGQWLVAKADPPIEDDSPKKR